LPHAEEINGAHRFHERVRPRLPHLEARRGIQPTPVHVTRNQFFPRLPRTEASTRERQIG